MPNFITRFIVLLILAWLNPATAGAWGPEGHFQVGKLALQNLDPTAGAWLHNLLAKDDLAAINKACNWPDHIRDKPGWNWSEPQHYVNIPRNASRYDRQRDCPDGLCVTEAIKKYAAQLDNPWLLANKKWEAFAWLCHLVGDLHQPLHAGYQDDRGGNHVQVSFRGERIDLHEFWDGALVRQYLGPNGSWPEPPSDGKAQAAGKGWNPAEADAWTDESHRLANEAAYPPGEIIQADFAQNGWLLVRQQWLKAGKRGRG